jgi:deoxyribose-phosphate aldolase
MITKQQIIEALDLAVLKPIATRTDVIQAATLVEDQGIASICVAPCNVRLAKRYTPRVSAVIGFPHGRSLIEVKMLEATQAIEGGASELDMVINYGLFLEGDSYHLNAELECIIGEVKIPVKVILETCFYTPAQIKEACKICVNCGAAWVKSSTGLYGGITPGVARLMLDAVKGQVGVKASGGIKNYSDASYYLHLGCNRIGSSCFEKLLP